VCVVPAQILNQVTLINIKDITVKYGEHIVLDKVSLDVAPGEIVTIVGPNGSGKTSLVKTIIGALKYHSGSLIIKNNLRIGYIPQRLNIDHTLPMTVQRFLNLTHRLTKDECLKALSAAGASGLLEAQMSNLSGGQFQRVLLARALQGDPEILILDEATQSLDQAGSADFYKQIESVRDKKGCAVLMISHELHVVMSASDKVICLNGHVCCSGAPEAVAIMPEYHDLFGTGTDGTLALYRHNHDHRHDNPVRSAEVSD
jgi:zinc transport system ATP-binding protein